MTEKEKVINIALGEVGYSCLLYTSQGKYIKSIEDENKALGLINEEEEQE